jgi:hypothetical protein
MNASMSVLKYTPQVGFHIQLLGPLLRVRHKHYWERTIEFALSSSRLIANAKSLHLEKLQHYE